MNYHENPIYLSLVADLAPCKTDDVAREPKPSRIQIERFQKLRESKNLVF